MLSIRKGEMTMGKIFILKNWHLQCIGCRVIAFGNVYGHTNFHERQKIHTSYITDLRTGEDDSIHIKTYVGNSYILLKEEQNRNKEIMTRHGLVMLQQWIVKKQKNEKKRAML